MRIISSLIIKYLYITDANTKNVRTRTKSTILHCCVIWSQGYAWKWFKARIGLLKMEKGFDSRSYGKYERKGKKCS